MSRGPTSLPWGAGLLIFAPSTRSGTGRRRQKVRHGDLPDLGIADDDRHDRVLPVQHLGRPAGGA